jgi:cytochrome c peroxidase
VQSHRAAYLHNFFTTFDYIGAINFKKEVMMPLRKPLLLLTLFAVVVALATSIARVQAQEPVRSETPQLPANLLNYESVTLPRHYTNPVVLNTDNTPANNPITDAGATLGRVLFYDVKLSANDSTACASCHQQANGFSDSAELSNGFNGGLTGRHSMGLSNARFYQNGRFFWDERAATLEAQVLMPIQDSVEMGMTLADLETKLATTSYYPELFEAAFGTPDVTSERISLALAQFVRSIVSYNSKFDAGLAANPRFSNLTQQERQGQQLFNSNRARCSQCHETDAFIADRPHNIGLDPNNNADAGAGDGRFKVASLRNIALTAPYMHDGRFDTLQQVINHYSHGIQNNPGLDPILRNNNGQPIRPNFNPQETQALVAFLNTLTDQSLMTDERFSDPFPLAAPTSVTLRPVETAAHPTAVLLALSVLLAAMTTVAVSYHAVNRRFPR